MMKVDKNVYDSTIPDFFDLDDVTEAVMKRVPDASEEYKGYIRLLLGVIASGIAKRDMSYLEGIMFKSHCILLGLDYEGILEALMSSEKFLAAKMINNSHVS